MTKSSRKNYTTTPQTKQTIESLWRLEKIILNTLDFKEVVQKITDSVLIELEHLGLGYRIVVLALVDKKANLLKRISISQTPAAKKALAETPVPFTEIDIPLSAKKNLCIKTLSSKKPIATSHWPDILSPPFRKKDAIEIQEKVGIKTSLVYPVVAKNETLGIIIFSMTKGEKEVSPQERDLIAGFTDVVGLAVQNSQLYTSLEDTTKKLKKANLKLKELDKLKDEFVYIASHELRTPMTAIKSYLWLALNKGEPLSGKMRKNLDRAYSATERLIKLVQNMLTVSRIDGKRLVVKMEKFDLGELAEQIYEELKIGANEKKIKFIFENTKTALKVKGDKTRIAEVIQNIVGNALKFTPEKGFVTITLTKNEQKLAQLEVIDSGPGIPKKNLSKLFQKFGRLESSYQRAPGSLGTGLGLYIAKQIVDLHKGKIWAESKNGKGSRFVFTLPLKA